MYTGAVAVTVANAAIAADVALLRDIPRGSAVVSGSVDSLEVAMVGGGTPLEALTHALDVYYALEEAESLKVTYESRLAGYLENCAEALDAAKGGEISKFLLLDDSEAGVGPLSRAAVDGRPFRSAVVGIKVSQFQSAVNYLDKGRQVRPHSCCVLNDDDLSTLGRAAGAGASFTAPDGSRIKSLQSADVDVVLVPIDVPILGLNTIKCKDMGRMKKEARFLYMPFVDALLDSDASFDDERLRRHYAVFKPGRGDWNSTFRGDNAWTWPGPPAERYPPGFGES